MDSTPENRALAARLAFRLGLTPMDRTEPICHGLQNTCVCPTCEQLRQDLAEGVLAFNGDGMLVRPSRPSQGFPWEQQAA